MTLCILHFGMHKTGTTSIQQSLFRSCTDERFHYIDLGSPNPSGRIATAFLREPQSFHIHRKRGTTPQELRRLRDETIAALVEQVNLARDKTAILSAEVISALAIDELARLCETLTRAGATRIKAVGYIRPPRSYLESAFQQSLKGGWRRPRLESVFPKYQHRFEKFDTVLGREQVTFWNFAPHTFPEHCVVQDFARRNGIDLGTQKPLKTNQALSLPAVQLLLIYRTFGPQSATGKAAIAQNRMLVSRLTGLRGAPLRFHPEYVAPSLQRHRTDIAWMEHRLGAPLVEEGAVHDAAVRSDVDLLDVPQEALEWLAAEIGEPLRGAGESLSVRDIAHWVHSLREGDTRQARRIVGCRRVDSRAAGAKDEVGKITQWLDAQSLLALVCGKDAQLEAWAASATPLIDAAFRCLARALSLGGEGKLVIPGMGGFRMKSLQNEEGQPTAIKRITFHPR